MCVCVCSRFRDAIETRNPFADQLLQHFYRWLVSSSSYLYDPALHRVVRSMMTKVFMQLLAELRKFGATVVMADFSKVILATGKHDLESAEAYVAYIKEALQGHNLFKFIALETTQYWEALLFLDQANYGGMQLNPVPDDVDVDADAAGGSDADAPVPRSGPSQGTPGRRRIRRTHGDASSDDDAAADSASDFDSDDDFINDVHTAVDAELSSSKAKALVGAAVGAGAGAGAGAKAAVDVADGGGSTASGAPLEPAQLEKKVVMQGQLVSNWNLAEYLPPYVEDCFLLIVGHFVQRPVRFRREHADSAGTDGFREQFASYCKRLVTGFLTTKVTDIVKDVMRLAGDEAQFPLRPGSHLAMTNPAVELIKSVCHVLGLDTTVQDDVHVLRKNLLRIVQVREFSPESVFEDPCLTYVLPDVICPACTSARDLDLARDATVLGGADGGGADAGAGAGTGAGGEASGGGGEGRLVWLCSHCNQPYDSSTIEAELVDLVQRRSMAFQVQDLYCSKCKGEKDSKLFDLCACAGRFVNGESPQKFRRSMRVFQNVARHHNLEWLHDTVQFVLEGTM